LFQHGGAIERGVLRPFGYVVPGSGTGDLRGLRGEAGISVTAAGMQILTLDYDFAEWCRTSPTGVVSRETRVPFSLQRTSQKGLPAR
jgi:hypothetical protein